jgi:hypothetical protein
VEDPRSPIGRKAEAEWECPQGYSRVRLTPSHLLHKLRDLPSTTYRYPVAYSICVIPLSIVRWLSFAHDGLHLDYLALLPCSYFHDTDVPSVAFFAVSFLFGLSGAFNVALFFATRADVLLFTRADDAILDHKYQRRAAHLPETESGIASEQYELGQTASYSTSASAAALPATMLNQDVGRGEVGELGHPPRSPPLHGSAVD